MKKGPHGYHKSGIEKNLIKRLHSSRTGTAGVKMGVAVFAPCLLAVVDGCFSLPANAARRLEQANKMLYGQRRNYITKRDRIEHLDVLTGFRKTMKK